MYNGHNRAISLNGQIMNKTLLGLFLLASVSSAYAQTAPAGGPPQSKRSEAYYHFSMARLLDEGGEWNKALDEYKKALEIEPNNSLIYSEMAEGYWRNQRAREAVETAQKAITLDPNNLDAHTLLKDIYMTQITRQGQTPTAQNIDLAIHEWEEIVRIDPTNRQGFLMLGRLYQAANAPEKAEAIYRKYLGVEPGSEDGVLGLARLDIDLGKNQAAVELLENFLKTRPDSDQAWASAGEAYSNLNEFKKAADAYKRALALSSDEPEWKNGYAQALFSAEDFAEAEKQYQQLLDEDARNGLAMLRLSQIARRQMKYDVARNYLRQAIRIFPDNIELLYNLFLTDRDEGQLEEALKQLADVTKRTEHANGRYNESELQNRRMFLTQAALLNSTLGRYDDAVAAFTNVKAITPTDKDRVDAYIVETYRTAKSPDKAMEYLQGALKQTPDSRQLQLLNAELLAERGRVEDGIKAVQKMYAGGEPDLQMLSTMASIYEKAKKFGDAQDILNTAAKKFPREEEVYFLQGALYERQKKVKEAEEAFRKALEIDKDNPAVLNYLGYMLADRGVRLEEALSMIQKAVDVDPINGAYLDSLGWAYFKLNRLDQAEVYLKRAVRFAPTNATMYEHLGDLYFKMARYQEAAAQWTKSLQFAEGDEVEKVRKKLDQAKTRVANNR
jgi:tetratricopeptide (TPR) repeat protein